MGYTLCMSLKLKPNWLLRLEGITNPLDAPFERWLDRKWPRFGGAMRRAGENYWRFIRPILLIEAVAGVMVLVLYFLVRRHGGL